MNGHQQRPAFLFLIVCWPLLAGFFIPLNVFSEDSIIELKISHFGSEQWVMQKELLEPWANKIETLSEGRVKFKIYPQQQLGPSNKQYDLAVDGDADIALGLQGYNQKRFPLTSVMTLPFMGQSGEKASIVLWALYEKYLKAEYPDVKVLALFCHGPSHLHTVNKQVKTIEDLKGLKIRMSNPFLGKIMESLGATAVVTPVPNTTRMLQQEELDGVCVPWEGFYDFNFLTCKHHTILNLYTLPFFIVMNKDKFNSLPADIKKIIEENSGENMSALAGRAMDNRDNKGRSFAEKRGDEIYMFPPEELARWKNVTLPFGDSWVEEMESNGLPGLDVLRYTVDLLIQLQK